MQRPPPIPYAEALAQASNSARVTAPAATRNGAAIADALRRRLDRGERPVWLLEVASGTGQHAALFAETFPELVIQPSDCTPDAFESIVAWTAPFHPRVHPPVVVDLTVPATFDQFEPSSFDAVYACNLLHISPWAATQGLMQCARLALRSGGLLIIYGAVGMFGELWPESNAHFDAQLRERNPAWGVRHLEAVGAEALRAGLHLVELRAMPANNTLLVFEKL